MCDFLPGQLILCFPALDPAGNRTVELIKTNQIAHVRYGESIEDRIGKAGAKIPKAFEYTLHLVMVPPGEEEWKVTYLQFYYKAAMLQYLGSPGTNANAYLKQFASRSNYHFIAAPNHVLSISSIGAVIGRLFGRSSKASGIVDASKFSFSSDHIQYKSLLALNGPFSSGTKVRMGVFDTGIGTNFLGKVAGQYDFTGTSQKAGSAPDDHGHGTMVSMVINDVAAGCEFMMMKVADSSGTAAEWDLLAALCADHQCDVVNLSLSFGLQDVTCKACGRQSHGSRSAVFENIVTSLAGQNRRPVIVAAAGNQSLQDLEYPARFGNVLAVGSVDSTKSLSLFSNVGNTTHDGQSHSAHCVATGGQSGGSEAVGTSPHDKYFGTSFAAAYASAIVARKIAGGMPSSAVLAHLHGNADTNLPNYSTVDHGFGLLRA